VNASHRRHAQGAAASGRLFFVAPLLFAGLLAGLAACVPSANAVATNTVAANVAAASAAWVASAAPGSQRIALFDCASGDARAAARLQQPLAAPLAYDPRTASLYAATADAELLRYALPGLELRARVPLGFVARTLAVGTGPDALLLAGGDGQRALSAHDPESLAPLERYTLAPASGVAAILDVAGRGRFVVGFADAGQLWEIAYARDAPPVLRGLVHDYRMGEAVPLPGRLTPRPFRVDSATRSLLAGPSSFEVLRIDTAGAVGVVNLDVRREIERPRLGAAADPLPAASWRSENARGWLVAASDGSTQVLAAPDWRPTTREPDGAGAAIAAARERLRVASSLARAHPGTVRVESAFDAGCAAAFDAQGRWLGSARLQPPSGP